MFFFEIILQTKIKLKTKGIDFIEVLFSNLKYVKISLLIKWGDYETYSKVICIKQKMLS